MTFGIGSVSHDTLRPQDLLPRFLDFLETIDKNKAKEVEKKYQKMSIMMILMNSGNQTNVLLFYRIFLKS